MYLFTCEILTRKVYFFGQPPNLIPFNLVSSKKTRWGRGWIPLYITTELKQPRNLILTKFSSLEGPTSEYLLEVKFIYVWLGYFDEATHWQLCNKPFLKWTKGIAIGFLLWCNIDNYTHGVPWPLLVRPWFSLLCHTWNNYKTRKRMNQYIKNILIQNKKTEFKMKKIISI